MPLTGLGKVEIFSYLGTVSIILAADTILVKPLTSLLLLTMPIKKYLLTTIDFRR